MLTITERKTSVANTIIFMVSAVGLVAIYSLLYWPK